MNEHEQVNLVKYPTREEWLADRVRGIGASESAALFGLSPYLSPFALWAEKTGMVPREDSHAEVLRWGLLLEAPIARAYADDTRREIWEPPTPWCVAVDRDLEVLRATPDRWILQADGRDSPGVLEIKNVDSSKSDLWSEMPPIHVQIQVQHQLAVTGFGWGAVAALIGGNRMRTWDVERNEDFIAELRAKVAEFWSMVASKQAPTVDGSESTAKALKALHPKDNGETVELGAEAVQWIASLQAAKELKKTAEADATAAENKIREAIGDATFGALPDGRRISLHTTEIAARTQQVAAYSYRAIRIQEPKTKTKKGKEA